jgi:phthalate 4,5-dioxygenase reductase subunit
MDGTRPLVVAGKRMLTAEICEFELADPAGNALEPGTAGAHVNVTTPSGDVRSYSLTGDISDAWRYRIAVRRSADGRGGSRSLVDDVHPGDTLPVSAPANDFALEPAADYLLIAAGIGITPIRALLQQILIPPTPGAATPAVTVLFLSRSPQDAAYLDDVRALVATSPGARLLVHHRRLSTEPLDLWSLVADPGERRLYCCGPTALEDTVRALTMHWRPSRVHFENFAGVSAFGELSVPFTATWAPTGQRVAVPAARTLLAALRGAGIDTPSSCESGTCGTCRTKLIAGEADHRDLVLTDAERDSQIMICVSRAKTPELVIDR